VKGVKGNPDWKENVEMRRLVDNADAREQPLEILEQKISVFKKAEHAQVHAHTRDQPPLLCALIRRLGNLAAQPEIHRRGRKKKRGERRIPGTVENVTGHDEQIFPQFPAANAPIKRHDNYEKDDKRERIKKHG
jgi:hypothetical protein